MSSKGVRWWLLAEGKNDERFALELAARLGLNDRPVSVSITPSGAGSAWVRRQYPGMVRTTVRKRAGERVVLIVMVDGDNLGFARRKRELDQTLADSGGALRTATEPVIVLVPTWSVETWLVIPPATLETVTFKNKLRDPLPAHYAQAVTRLVSPSPTDLPSIRDGSTELSRLP